MQTPPTPAPPPGASWSSRSVSDAERRRFFDEIATPGNLRRMFWLIVICLPISLGFFISNLLSLHEHALNPWLLFDLSLAGVFLVLNGIARKKGPAFRHGHTLVLAYYIYTLASMDGYYFTAFSRFGENTVYVLGMMMAAVLFRLPPRQFFTLLLTNHAIYIALSFHFKRNDDGVLSAMIGGLDALVVACIAAWFLFAREWGDFLKQRVIEERNRELAAANALLQRNNEEMNEIMAIAAHDLRSPLHSMKSWFELLGEQEAWRREPYAEVVTECGRACGGMLGLIARLLEAHAAETRSGPCLEKVAAGRLLEASLRKVEMAGKLRNVRFTTDFPGDGLTLETDPEALAQAVDNLLDNALKFSPAGSQVEVALFRAENRCRIEIRDEGSGVAEKDREKLFHKFHRGRNRPHGGAIGAGLGLFIVERLMEHLGGTVTHHPRPGRGSVFRLELPLSGR
ncbi:MAG TPA: HAMP domain-containing sensor histidine kinase [Chthoniobacteraceae bacterium]|nr:HAMP domain-containing sensor histidine kinase [Chthoniobacteraceae bacterium]